MDIPDNLLPLFWGACGLAGVSLIGLLIGLTLLLGAQRPHTMRVVWISSATLIASIIALGMVLMNGGPGR